MTSKRKHARRSRRDHGTPMFKSLDLANHDFLGFMPIFKSHPKKYDGKGNLIRYDREDGKNNG